MIALVMEKRAAVAELVLKHEEEQKEKAVKDLVAGLFGRDY